MTPTVSSQSSQSICDRAPSIAQWIYHNLRQTAWSVKTRQRGNILHILFEAEQCPTAAEILQPLIEALCQVDIQTLLAPEQPAVYLLMLYGRQQNQKHPQWKTPVHLNQLDRYLELLKQQVPEAEMAPPEVQTKNRQEAVVQSSVGQTGQAEHQGSSHPKDPHRVPKGPIALSPDQTIRPGAALILSNRTLASQGEADAIAYYLSETLSALGIAVEVVVRAVRASDTALLQESLTRTQRLHIICESTYSLDPAIIAEPIAQRLRDLKLEEFHDAAVVSQVRGEAKPDWILRVDLTPPEEMLQELARWGDLAALSRLLNQTLRPYQIEAEVENKDKTLHILCKLRQHDRAQPDQTQGDLGSQGQSQGQSGVRSQATSFTRTHVVGIVNPFLESLAPQGIHAAMIYGLPQQNFEQDTDPSANSLDSTGIHFTPVSPDWIDWLSLPASRHPDLGPTTQELAEEGDISAVTFLLDRLLNQDLDWQLATGGIRVRLRRKADLLHVMCDAPICPRQGEVGNTVAKFVRQLRLPRIAGVRIYGRRAGQKRPLWNHGLDFVPRQRYVSEATPEFAASADHVGDLLTASGVGILTEESETEDSFITLSTALTQLLEAVRQASLRSQLFLPADQSMTQVWSPQVSPNAPRWAFPLSQSVIIALVWGGLGLLITVRTDWWLAQQLQQVSIEPEVATVLTPTHGGQNTAPNAAQQEAALPKVEPDPFADITLEPATSRDNTVADSFAEGDIEPNLFDQQGFTEAPPPELPFKRTASSSSTIRHIPDYPSFNNAMLDQKLALYQEYLLEDGPPDVLIVGSSRALRGIDPQVLADHLESLGYPKLRIFNFAINGSTAQVVNLQLRRILRADQLPRLILWADGARAFNSGRTDATYNAIASSVGYQQILAGTLPTLLMPPDDSPEDSTTVVQASDADDSFFLDTGFPNQISIDFNQWLTDKMGEFSSVYAKRDRLKQVLVDTLAQRLPSFPSAPPEPEPTPILENLESEYDALDPEFSRIPDAPEGEGSIQFNGFLSLSLRFNPATYYQKYARVLGQYDGDYQSFRLEGQQFDALDILLTYANDLEIPIVFVNLPLTADYLDPTRTEHEKTFQTAMYRLVTSEKQLIFRNLVELWPEEVGNFSDPSHLNRYGAYEVSVHLAEDLLIPWPSAID